MRDEEDGDARVAERADLIPEQAPPDRVPQANPSIRGVEPPE